METEHADDGAVLGQPLELPCGARLKNRIVKAAMSDSLGDGRGNPTCAQMRLYERWAEGGAALSLIGEVQTDPRYPEKPGNLVLVPDADMAALQRLAARGSAHGAKIWPQLGHAGALAHAPLSTPKGPSPLDVEGLRCGGMTAEEIAALPDAYARAAAQARQAGFGGVEIHAGHGFLFSQFLSPLFNRRGDGYGGPVAARFRVIGETLGAVRRAVGPAFPVAVKINATDRLAGGLGPDEALEVVRMLDRASADLIDISGGTYFPGAPASSEGSSASGPYFLDFARRAKAVTRVPLMLTGGIKTRAAAAMAVRSGAADAVGIARALALDPSLAAAWLDGPGGDPAFPSFEAPPPGAMTAWYSMRLAAIGEESERQFDRPPAAAMAEYDARDAARCAGWLARFA
ncbi:oxidoreductase [Mangrovicoccus sp. HB161399]|uniref:oxidoreductase n=1 Tax=Mangrovicoccus sp. HB161399 TaxID=2720392 RepID=UPI00155630CC|nr:oxidoreductase [Mangrovicoccus sp. HB161399]